MAVQTVYLKVEQMADRMVLKKVDKWALMMAG